MFRYLYWGGDTAHNTTYYIESGGDTAQENVFKYSYWGGDTARNTTYYSELGGTPHMNLCSDVHTGWGHRTESLRKKLVWSGWGWGGPVG